MLRNFDRRTCRNLIFRKFSSSNATEKPLQVCLSSEVAEAKKLGIPIIALESTIISHGMPYPQNLTVARELEDIVRRKGSVPATIAIMEGVPCIGLSDLQLETLAREQKNVTKVSTRDIAHVMAGKKTGATTVAATMRLAHLAGISVFATGGLGGVHRGVETTMDISTDLMELGRTPVTVVCAGIKSILDVAKSLEVLETQGVPVVGYKTDIFPAFFTNDSGLKVHARAESAEEIAKIIRCQQSIVPSIGCVVAVQNPHPADSVVVDTAIRQALQEAESKHIVGNAITPFLLERIEKLTGGKSLEANIALVKHNVEIACDVAHHLSNCSPGYKAVFRQKSVQEEVITMPHGAKDVVVVGGATVDIVSRVAASDLDSSHSTHEGDIGYHPGSSNPGHVEQSFGGVGRNVASYLARHGATTALLSAWADDTSGLALSKHCAETCKIDTSCVQILPEKETRTAVYNAIHSSTGELIVGVADMGIHAQITPSYISEHRAMMAEAKVIVSDANISEGAFQMVADLTNELGKPLFFEPTSDHKCVLPLRAKRLHQIAMMKPNAGELICMVRYAKDKCKKDFPHLMWHNIELLLREAEIEVVMSHRQDVETLALLSATLMDLMHSKPVSLSSSPSSTVTSESSAQVDIGNIITNKHLLVSLGAQGLLWTAPKTHFEATFGEIRDGTQLRVENFDLRTHVLSPNYLSVHLMDSSADIGTNVCSNGAGDALFAAVIRSVLNGASGRDGKPHPNIEDILSGMHAARQKLKTSREI